MDHRVGLIAASGHHGGGHEILSACRWPEPRTLRRPAEYKLHRDLVGREPGFLQDKGPSMNGGETELFQHQPMGCRPISSMLSKAIAAMLRIHAAHAFVARRFRNHGCCGRTECFDI